MKKKIIRISTVPMSLDLLLQGQLRMLSEDYEVQAVSSPGKELERVGRREGVRTYSVPMERRISPVKDMVALFRLIRLFREERPWAVHSLTPKAGLLAMMAAWLCRVPIRIHTFTGLVFPTAKGLKQKLLIATDRMTCFCATHINPEGKGVKHDLERFHITSKPLQIIGNGNINGIDLQYFARTTDVMQKAAGLVRKDVVTFCFIGRVVGDKGINELVNCFKELHTDISLPTSRLLLVGSMEEQLDPVQPKTMELIRELPCIEYIGWQEDIRPWLAASDVFVFPSYREGFPNVVLQAGAMGLPCIVTDINGCNEIIEEGVNGMIIPPRNQAALSEAIQKMLHPSIRERLAMKSRQRIADRYEQKALWKELKNMYHSIE